MAQILLERIVYPLIYNARTIGEAHFSRQGNNSLGFLHPPNAPERPQNESWPSWRDSKASDPPLGRQTRHGPNLGPQFYVVHSWRR